MKNLSIILSIFILFIFSKSAFNQDVVSIEQVAKSIKVLSGSTSEIQLKVRIEKSWHINSNKPNEDYLIPAKLSLEPTASIKLLEVIYPQKSVKEIKLNFSDVPLSVFEDEFILTAKIQISENLKDNQKINFIFEYQACNNSTCLPPTEIKLPVSLTLDKKIIDTMPTEIAKKDSVVEKKSSSVKIESYNNQTTKPINTKNDSESNGIFDEKNLLLSLFLIFLAGLGLNLTPCVYPLIMITIGFFGGQSESKTSKLFVLSLIYVLGISLMYSVLGVVAAMTGGLFGSALQNPYVIGTLVLILIAMALSMFGLYEIQPPASLMNKVGNSKSGYFGAFFMGLTMGIAAAPCIGPVIISLLSIIGNKGDIFLGFIIFFTLSLGLGLPYLFLGMFSGKIKQLPRSGEWMIGIKKIFGIIILTMALYFLNPLIGEPYSAYTIPVFLIQSCLYLAFYDKSGESSKVFKIIKYVLIVIAFNYSIFSIIPSTQKTEKDDWIKPATLNFLEKGRPVLLDFYADWCIPCKELDKFTFSNPKVISKLNEFNKYKLDLTKNSNPLTVELIKKFNIKGVPTLIIMDSELNEIKRITGFIEAEFFLKELEKAN